MTPRPPILGTAEDLAQVEHLLTDLPSGGDLRASLVLARDLGARLPAPGAGSTLALWEALATLGAADLTLARVVEPHVDAVAILRQAGLAVAADTTWGVYAAEGPGVRLQAHLQDGGQWRLEGIKPWCSLARDVSHALVTAWVDDTHRGLFSVDLRQPGVTHGEDPWVPTGLSGVRSAPVRFDGLSAEPVGGPGWYLTRDGFAWGGLGVAAIWHGGAVGVARRLAQQAEDRQPDQIGLAHLGTVDATLTASRALLREAAAAIDEGQVAGEAGARLALRVRQVVADAVEEVLRRADHALGPGPLATESAYAGRVADLRMYVRQHHAERDAATLGRIGGPDRPW